MKAAGMARVMSPCVCVVPVGLVESLVGLVLCQPIAIGAVVQVIVCQVFATDFLEMTFHWEAATVVKESVRVSGGLCVQRSG